MTLRKAATYFVSAGIVAAMAVSIPTLVAATDNGIARCSNRTLKGDYAFGVDGQIFPPGGPALVLRGIAMTTFDGRGGLTQVDHGTLNGVPRPGWRPAVGSYEVNPDCTGTMQLIFSDGSPMLNLHMVVFDRGRQVRNVVDGNATGALGVKVH